MRATHDAHTTVVPVHAEVFAVLDPGNQDTQSWPRPGRWRRPGPEAPGVLVRLTEHLTSWTPTGATIWLVETTGHTTTCGDRLVAPVARLVRPIGVLTPRVLRLAACAYAEAIAGHHGHNPVCMGAITTARLHAHDLTEASRLTAARDAVWRAGATPSMAAAAATVLDDPASALMTASTVAAHAAALTAADAAPRDTAWITRTVTMARARHEHGRILTALTRAWGATPATANRQLTLDEVAA